MTTTSSTNTDIQWQSYWSGVGNEEYLTARRLLELSYDVRTDVAQHLAYVPEETWTEDDGEYTSGGYWKLDWDAWAKTLDDPETEGPYFSSTGWRLARLVASLTTGAKFDLIELTRMGSWETEVWDVLVNWGTGGNNREYAGRARVVTR